MHGAEDDADGVSEVVVDVLGANRAVGKADLERGAERIVAVALDQVVQLVDVADPDLGPAMNELGDVGERGLAEADQVLALHLAFGAPARDRSDALGAMFGQGGAFVTTKLALMLGLVAARDDADTVARSNVDRSIRTNSAFALSSSWPTTAIEVRSWPSALTLQGIT